MTKVRKYLHTILGLVVFVLTLSTVSVFALNVGDVITSWTPTGVVNPWGVGYNGNVWISDVDTFTPNLKNVEFLTNGTPTGRSWSTPWVGAWPGDMAYDSGRGWMWQVNVGGDNGIYGWNPSTGTVMGSITGAFPWTSISQRGLAYRPDNDTFYIGGWNQGIIYNIYGLSYGADSGKVIGQFSPSDGVISGLAWDSVGILWESSATNTIYALNPTNGQVLLSFPHPDSSQYGTGVGLEINEDRNLWTVSQFSDKVYLVYTGSPAPPVPEPATMFLLGSGLLGLWGARKKFKK